MLELGQIAPDFTLKDHNDQEVRPGDLRGSWVVLYFYPKDDTPGCTVEACEFTDGLERFQGLSARVFGISPDSPASHRKFIAKHSLKVGLLSDPEHGMIERYRAWGEKNMYGKKSFGVVRSTVLLDPAGRVVKHWPKVSAAGHAAEVAAALAELQGTASAAPAAPAAATPKAKASRAPRAEVADARAASAKPAGKATAKSGAKAIERAIEKALGQVSEKAAKAAPPAKASRAPAAKVKPASKTPAKSASKAAAPKSAAPKSTATKSAATKSAGLSAKAGSKGSAAGRSTASKSGRAQAKSAGRAKG